MFRLTLGVGSIVATLEVSSHPALSTAESFPMLFCPHPLTTSMLSGDSRNQRPQNLDSLQGTHQQQLVSSGDVASTLLSVARPWVLILKPLFPHVFQLPRAKILPLSRTRRTPGSVHSALSMEMRTRR